MVGCFGRAHLQLFVLCASGLFLRAGGGEDIGHRVVPFVAGVFEDRTFRLLHRNFSRPRSFKGLRIVDRELVEKCVSINAGEAFDADDSLLDKDLHAEIANLGKTLVDFLRNGHSSNNRRA